MSNPSDPDKSIDDGNQMPLPTTPKGKQRAVELPSTPRLNKRNPQPEQGNIPISPSRKIHKFLRHANFIICNSSNCFAPREALQVSAVCLLVEKSHLQGTEKAWHGRISRAMHARVGYS
jgi:hypothetical protein